MLQKLSLVCTREHIFKTVTFSCQRLNVEIDLLMIERRGRDLDQPDEPVVIIEGKGDQWLGGISSPSAVSYAAPMVLVSGYCRRWEYDRPKNVQIFITRHTNCLTSAAFVQLYQDDLTLSRPLTTTPFRNLVDA